MNLVHQNLLRDLLNSNSILSVKNTAQGMALFVPNSTSSDVWRDVVALHKVVTGPTRPRIVTENGVLYLGLDELLGE